MNFHTDGDCSAHSSQNIMALGGVEVGLAGITTQEDCHDYCVYKVLMFNINKKSSMGRSLKRVERD